MDSSPLGGGTAGNLRVTRDASTPVEWFVTHAVSDLGLGSRSVDQRCKRILLRLALWATAEGVPLDREAILDPETVERFCAVGLAGESSRATHRSDLRRMAQNLTRKAPWEIPPVPLARRNVVAPYAPTGVTLLRSDAHDQPTAARRRGARALLALGLGAGLDGRWVARVVAGDVMRRGLVVEVSVGEPAPRRIVVRADWEEELLELAATAGSGCLLGRHSSSRHRVGDFVKRLYRPAGHPRLSPARLRSTWLASHLRDGTRLPELCAAAGLQGFEVLSDLMAYVPPLPSEVADEMLRGMRC